MHCRSPEDLLQLALAPAIPDGEDCARHVAICDSCQAELRELRRTMRPLRLRSPDATPVTACLTDDWIASFAEGGSEPMKETAQLGHLLRCASCRERLTSVARLLRDTAVAEQVQLLTASKPPKPQPRSRLFRMATVMIAAAAVVVILIGRAHWSDSTRTPAFREPGLTEATPPVSLSPIGEVSAVDSVTWRSVAGANRYRLILFDRDGTLLWETQTGDTAVVLPSNLALPEGDTYLWRVEARVGWEDRWVASELTEFTIRRAATP